MQAFRRTFLASLFAFSVISASAAPALAQVAARPSEPTADAESVREAFVEVLRKYPPAVRQVLKLDPSLLANDQYLAPYPEILSFFAKHPEVRRSPAYYFEQVSTGSIYYYDPRARPWANQMEAISIFDVRVD